MIYEDCGYWASDSTAVPVRDKSADDIAALRTNRDIELVVGSEVVYNGRAGVVTRMAADLGTRGIPVPESLHHTSCEIKFQGLWGCKLWVPANALRVILE